MMIFFDIDETLLNQRQAEAAAAERFLQQYGRLLPELTPPELSARWRTLREKHLPPFLHGAISFTEHRRRRIRELFIDGAGLTDDEADERFEHFSHEYRRNWRLFDDVPACLASLNGEGLGVLSNGSSGQQRQKLQQTGILDRFSTIVISEDIGLAKPGREIYLAACRIAGCRPDECVYVGDRLEADALGSRSAGMRGIWLDRRRCGATTDIEFIHTLTELPARLQRHAAPGHAVRTAGVA
jgi:putative hydrolase of the HAD superfamily